MRARLSNPLPKTQAVKGGMCGGFRIGRGDGAFPKFGEFTCLFFLLISNGSSVMNSLSCSLLMCYRKGCWTSREYLQQCKFS